MSHALNSIKYSILSFLGLVVGLLWSPLAVYLDIVVIGHGMPEQGVTEISQSIFIGLSAILFFKLMWTEREQRGFLVLVASFFLCMFVREQDALLDMIKPGLWQYLVAGIAGLSVLMALFWRKNLLVSMAEAAKSYPFAYILAGIALLLFFSRVFGTGALWEAIFTHDLDRSAPRLLKNTIQEGIELAAYALILYGSLLYTWEQKRRGMPLPDRNEVT
ncbi:hypothetical protein DN062_08125 [Nitrincola tibetensis]|uniref:Uncharacterized protein n=1 Tax=Nitrincola tibetensis TaxID=2219697 RepID=A0A364NMT2_9GAMM|nr:hypothetical protein [Nitrincola tibetensis]RAU18197.1 hypothetical protein DN062_08125 [Nitrincola tibetensis]